MGGQLGVAGAHTDRSKAVEASGRHQASTSASRDTSADIPGNGTAARLIAQARSNERTTTTRQRPANATARQPAVGDATGQRPVSHTTGQRPVSGTAGQRSVSRTTGQSPVNGTAGMAASTKPRTPTGRGTPSTAEGLRRWLEPSTYSALLAAAVAWLTDYWQRRRLALTGLTLGQRIWVRTRLVGLTGLALFVVLPALLFAIGYLVFSVPTTDEAVSKQIATISFSDKSELARIVPEEGNRTKVTIDQVPRPVQLAVLAAEDRSFFSNPGFSPIGIARAAFKQLTGGVGGGSTITQQYVKKTLVGDEASLWRKYKEMVIAVKISRQNKKDEILANYLNAIYFGRGAYGIQSASQAYFGKNVGDLSVSEGALLAGVIQSPSRWDPAISPPRAVQRWTFVMDGMLSQGWITPEQREQARFPGTQPRTKTTGGSSSDYRGLILNAIRDELDQKGISEQEFNQEGLRITTTIDPAAQQNAVESARKALIGQPPNLRGALVSIDPTTGGILAYYGGDNGTGLDYARVSKQPGSTFKPFVLLAALEQSDPIGLGTRFKGSPIAGLRNSDGADCQVCDLKQATTISNNVIFHELALRVGPQKVADAARQAGITTSLTDVNEGIALGNKEVSPIELASAYATFAADGVYHAPHLVTRVTTSDDRVIYDAVIQQDRRFSAQVARNVTEAMLGVPVSDKLSLNGGRLSAAKTGTVQSHLEGENNDAWIAGYTPSVATSVWIGTDENSPIRTSQGKPITGASLPGTIWKTFMNDVTKSQPDQSFGLFKPIGPPPAAAGPADGLAAGPAQPAIPPQVFDPLPPGSPPDVYVRDIRRPDNTRRQPSTHRECGQLGCRTVPDNG
ncbi:MAG: transglycosylase domain-containing protein [Actinomycetota bacterium]|nr:transglycosylase domain-containing protein [Actinomycetota bacterium]